jgi:hypothetical protein
MAQFYNISREEMEQFLTAQGFSLLPADPTTTELVFGRRVPSRLPMALSLRVYSGISQRSGASREVGEDAIRVALFARLTDGRIVRLSGSRRVHRVEGWRTNLQARLDRWAELVPGETCKCGLPMVARKGKHGKFLGCVGFPACSNTRQIAKER